MNPIGLETVERLGKAVEQERRVRNARFLRD